MLARLVTPLYWLGVGVIALALFPVALLLWLLTVAFDRRRVVMHAFTNVWGSLYTWINPIWTVKIFGRDRIDGSQPYVMVSNHLSMVDIFVLHRLFRHFKWVSKIEAFRIPVIGWNMRLCDYIPLRRGEKSSVMKMFAHCRKALSEGSSVMMFPEGTRSRTGRLKDFKPGAFELAKEARVPIQPVVIQGTFEALPAGGLRVGPARMCVHVLPSIGIDEVDALSVQELSCRVREQIAAFQDTHPWPPSL